MPTKKKATQQATEEPKVKFKQVSDTSEVWVMVEAPNEPFRRKVIITAPETRPTAFGKEVVGRWTKAHAVFETGEELTSRDFEVYFGATKEELLVSMETLVSSNKRVCDAILQMRDQNNNYAFETRGQQDGEQAEQSETTSGGEN